MNKHRQCPSLWVIGRCNDSRSESINCLGFQFFGFSSIWLYINCELQIMSDRHRRSGLINFWDRLHLRFGSIRFVPIYS